MRKAWKAFLFLIFCLTLGACNATGRTEGFGEYGDKEQTSEVKEGDAQAQQTSPAFDDMIWEQGLALSHANQFFVEKSEEYYLITIVENGRFLLVPEGKKEPTAIPNDITVLQQPLERVYLASSSVFDLIRQTGAISNLRFSGSKKEDLCIAEVTEAMDAGTILYAGKYSKPDYELLLAGNCDLAIENTMIHHNPETKEKLESLGIPVMVETSSYESHPFGRMEWIKLYGLLFDHLEEANEFYETQTRLLSSILQQEKTDKQVAFFYVNSNGAVNVRKPGDYVAKMIEMAGGSYVLSGMDQESENALSTMNMQMEDFYLAAVMADLIIYNSTIVGELSSIQDLIDLNPVFADFKAVKTGNVYCTGRNFFQEPTAMGDFVEDLGKAMRDQNETEFHQLKKLVQ